MKKIYFFLLIAFSIFTCFSQNPEIISKQRAEKIALQRSFNAEETARFVEKATTIGVNLKPNAVAKFSPPVSVQSAANNLDFETQNFIGWAGKYASSNCTSPTPNTASTFSIDFTSPNKATDHIGICTGGNDTAVVTGVLPRVNPYGGTASCRLGDMFDGCGSAYLSQSFTVNFPDTQIILYYAVIVTDGHVQADAPKFGYTVKDSSGSIVHSLYRDATQGVGGSYGFLTADPNNPSLYYSPWASDTFSLAALMGQDITIELYSSDCNGGGHRGYAYIDFNMFVNSSSNACGWLNPTNTCFATTDNNLNNAIYFNHNPFNVPQQGTIVYRKNGFGGWDSLGTVPAGQPDMFVDNMILPGTSYTYCVTPIDSCKNNYPKSPPHATIGLQSNMSGNGQINLSWNAYTGTGVSNYHIYRGTSLTGLSYIGQVSSTTYTFTDVNPPIGNLYYRVGFVKPGNCTSNAIQDSIVQSNYVNHTITCNNAVSPAASVCFVTTNDSLKNEVFFEHTNTGLEGTIIYRQNSMSLWDSIGFVFSSQTDHFIDLVANPNQQAYVYCVESMDSCGNLHGKSSPHTTILLQSSLGTGSQVNLSWNAYLGTPVASYYIYRGTSSSNMTFLNQVSSSTFAYTDLNPPTGNIFYRIHFIAPAGCTSNEPHGPLVGSNYKTNNIIGIASVQVPDPFIIYPNPGNAVLHIECGLANTAFIITGLLGNQVKTATAHNGKATIDITELPNGIYFVSAKDEPTKNWTPKKFVVRH